MGKILKKKKYRRNLFGNISLTVLFNERLGLSQNESLCAYPPLQ